jgi:nucleoside-diphosphate-sugar epimerase
MLYADGGDRWLDEDSDVRPVKLLESAADMENTVRSSRLHWTILRGGLLYGASTGRESGWLQQARDGSLRVPGDGTGYVSLIHQVDLANAFGAACMAPASNRIFNIVDDEPTAWRDLLNFIAKYAGAPAPLAGGPVVFPSHRVTNRRATIELKWKPEVPSYRDGFTRSGDNNI